MTGTNQSAAWFLGVWPRTMVGWLLLFSAYPIIWFLVEGVGEGLWELVRARGPRRRRLIAILALLLVLVAMLLALGWLGDTEFVARHFHVAWRTTSGGS